MTPFNLDNRRRRMFTGYKGSLFYFTTTHCSVRFYSRMGNYPGPSNKGLFVLSCGA